MKSTVLAASALLLVSADRELATQYAAETALRVESKLELGLETTAMSMVRDGEPVEGRGMGGGSQTTLRSVVVDRCVEVAAGAPSRVRRSWAELEGEVSMNMGGEDRSLTLESDFADLVVELVRDEDGEVSAEAVEGSGPAVELLARLRPELALDAFLPAGAVAEGAEWTLDAAAVQRGLGLDVTLFRRPEREGEGGGGQGGGGRRGGFGGRGGSAESMLAAAEWSGRASFAALEEFEGVECARIALALAGESETDEESSSSSFQAKLEGSLWFDVAARRPVGLDLEGTLASEMDMTREREGSVTEIHRESAGTYVQRVRVAVAPYQSE